MSAENLSVEEKALRINLDPSKYGTFAEIGAGQEVARNFFQAGGAAGMSTKTMSAYDMKFSDAIYGDAGRYVSRKRLVQMMQHEYTLLEERLSEAHLARNSFLCLCQHSFRPQLPKDHRMPWLDGDPFSVGTAGGLPRCHPACEDVGP